MNRSLEIARHRRTPRREDWESLGDGELVRALRQRRGSRLERHRAALPASRLCGAVSRRPGRGSRPKKSFTKRSPSLRNIGSIREPERVRAWVVTTARRLTIDAIRERTNQKRNESDEFLLSLADEKTQIPEEIELLETQHFVRRAIGEIPRPAADSFPSSSITPTSLLRTKLWRRILRFPSDPSAQPGLDVSRSCCWSTGAWNVSHEEEDRPSDVSENSVHGLSDSTTKSLTLPTVHQGKNHFMTHPTLDELLEACLARNRGEKVSERIEQHLSTACSACEARLQEIERVVQAMITDRTPEPPASWVRRAMELFPKPSLAARLQEFGSGLVEEAGRIVFSSSSANLPSLAGARGASTIRRLRFEARTFELDLQIESSGRGGSLLGQLLVLKDPVTPCAGARLLATSGTSHLAETVSDDLGEFSLSLPDFADLRLRISTGERVLVFDIPAPSIEE